MSEERTTEEQAIYSIGTAFGIAITSRPMAPIEEAVRGMPLPDLVRALNGCERLKRAVLHEMNKHT